MNPAPITSLTAAALALLMLALAARVVMLRRSTRTGLGHGESRSLERAIRVHANATEYVPLALILMLLFELSRGPAWALWLAAGVLATGRALHVFGVSRHSGISFGRFYGTFLTWCTIAGLAAADALHAIHSL
jgi:uncharacterized membrane protein YecN with MAPEG domain